MTRLKTTPWYVWLLYEDGWVFLKSIQIFKRSTPVHAARRNRFTGALWIPVYSGGGKLWESVRQDQFNFLPLDYDSSDLYRFSTPNHQGNDHAP